MQAKPNKRAIQVTIVLEPRRSICLPQKGKEKLPTKVPIEYSVLTRERLKFKSVMKCSIKIETVYVCPGLVMMIPKVPMAMMIQP